MLMKWNDMQQSSKSIKSNYYSSTFNSLNNTTQKWVRDDFVCLSVCLIKRKEYQLTHNIPNNYIDNTHFTLLVHETHGQLQ